MRRRRVRNVSCLLCVLLLLTLLGGLVPATPPVLHKTVYRSFAAAPVLVAEEAPAVATPGSGAGDAARATNGVRLASWDAMKTPTGVSSTQLAGVTPGLVLAPVSAGRLYDEYAVSYHLVERLRAGGTSLRFLYAGEPDYYAIIDLVNMVYPYYFCLDIDIISGKTNTIDISVRLFSDAEQRQQEALAREIVAKIITAQDTPAERVKRIHDWIAANVAYDFDYGAHGDRPFTAYGAFTSGLAVCAGYTDAFTLMARAAGLTAIRINGFAATSTSDEGHAWNAVLLDGKWQYIDVTWDDTDSIRRPSDRGSEKIVYDYYLISKTEMDKEHKPSAEFERFVYYVNPERSDAADVLRDLGLFQGSATGYRLKNVPTRAEAAVMLTRLLGREEEALSQNLSHPFADVPAWASAQIGWLYANGLAQGTGATKFTPNKPVTLAQYLTFILRALGYADGKDFTYEKAAAFAKTKELLPASLEKALGARPFLRADLVTLSFTALGRPMAAGGETLVQALVTQGAVASDAEARLRQITLLP